MKYYVLPNCTGIGYLYINKKSNHYYTLLYKLKEIIKRNVW